MGLPGGGRLTVCACGGVDSRVSRLEQSIENKLRNVSAMEAQRDAVRPAPQQCQAVAAQTAQLAHDPSASRRRIAIASRFIHDPNARIRMQLISSCSRCVSLRVCVHCVSL